MGGSLKQLSNVAIEIIVGFRRAGIGFFGVVICNRLNYIISFGELGAIFGRSSDDYVDRMS